jgi:hypothetical protein
MQDANLRGTLAGQKVFHNNGLPSPPKAEPFGDASSSESVPCLVQNGNHYYQPPGAKPIVNHLRHVSQAVLALQESVSETNTPKSTNVVIANGSKKPFPSAQPNDGSPSKKRGTSDPATASAKPAREKLPTVTVVVEQDAVKASQSSGRPQTAKSHAGSSTPSTPPSHRKTLSDNPQNV